MAKLSEINNSLVATVGADITEWTAYTPSNTQGFGTITSRLQWRRVGESVEIQGDFTAGTTVGSEAQIELPNSYTVDFTGTTGTASVGSFNHGLTQTLAHTFSAIATDGDTFLNVGETLSGGDTGSLLIAINGNRYSTSRRISVQATVPVVEFKGVQISSGLPVATASSSGTVELNSNFAATATTYGVVKLQPKLSLEFGTSSSQTGGTTLDYDTEKSTFPKVGTWTHVNGLVTIPETGYYHINACLQKTTNFTSNAELEIFKDTGGGMSQLGQIGISMASGSNKVWGSYIAYFDANDDIELQLNTTITAGNTATDNWFTIVKISD